MFGMSNFLKQNKFCNKNVNDFVNQNRKNKYNSFDCMFDLRYIALVIIYLTFFE